MKIIRLLILSLLIIGIFGYTKKDPNPIGTSACELIDVSVEKTAGSCSVANMNLGDDYRCCYDKTKGKCVYLQDNGDAISEYADAQNSKVDCSSSTISLNIATFFSLFLLFI